MITSINHLKTKVDKINIEPIAKIFIVILIICGAIILSRYNFLLYHTIVEIFIVVVGLTLLILNIIRIKFKLDSSDYITFISISYGFISIFYLLHTISQGNNGILSNSTGDLSTQFWIAGIYMESISILITSLYIKFNRKVNIITTILMYTLITIILILTILSFDTIPKFLNENKGTIDLDIVSKCIITIILSTSIYLIRMNRSKIDKAIYKSLLIIIIFKIISQVLFVLYGENKMNDDINAISHIVKAISFYILYKSVIMVKIMEPYQLLENEKRTIEAILNSSKNGLLVLGNKLELVYMNKEFNEILSNKEHFDMIVYKEGNEIYKDIKKYLENPEVFGEMVNKSHNDFANYSDYIYTVDGKIIEVSLHKFCINEEDKGRVLRLVDVTYKKRAEEIKKKSEENKIKLKEEIKYNKLRNQLFSNVSHELKTPLNIILGSTQLIDIINSKNNNLKDMKNIRNHISLLKKNSYRLLRILNNVIDITRYDSGFMNIKLGNYNIINIVEEITLSVIPFAEEKGINIIFDTEIEEKIISCDPDKIERIILNLLSNAIKFTEHNGSIFVNIFNKSGNIDIIITDTGIGIPKEKIDTIFNRFEQVHSDQISKGEGSGIGLYLVKSLVKAHKGQVSLESSLGKGTKFIISFPTADLIKDDPKEKCNVYIQDKLVERLNIELSDIYEFLYS